MRKATLSTRSLREASSAAPCSSPTSCATSTRMRSAAGSICRARSSTATASATPIRRAVLRHPALPAACRDLADDRDRAFRRGRARRWRRCSRRAMRPAAMMGAFYRAMLDAMLRDGWRDPSRADQPVEGPQIVAGAAPRAGMSGRERVHVVGAGLAGLAAAVDAGRGGPAGRALRNRASMPAGAAAPIFDAELGVRIDNGNHLLLSGNALALCRYLDMIGARDTFERPGRGGDPVCRSGERRALDLAAQSRRRAVVGLLCRAAGAGEPGAATISPRCGCGRAAAAIPSPSGSIPPRLLFRRLWEPVAVAALNTGAEAGSARALLAHPGRDLGPRRRGLPAAGAARGAVAKALSTRRWRCCARTGPRSASAPGCGRSALAQRRVDRASTSTARSSRSTTATTWCWRFRRRSRRASCPDLIVPDDHAPIVNAHFRYRRAGGHAALRRARRRHRGMGVSQARGHVGDGQRRRPARRSARPRSSRDILWRDVARRLRPAGRNRCRPRASSRNGAPHFAPRRRSCGGARRQRRAGTIFTLRAIMSILACPPRSKALFAPALRRRPSAPSPRSGAGAARPDASGTPDVLRSASARCHDERNDGTNSKTPVPAAIRAASMSRSRARPTRCCRCQHEDGHWVFELEADATIPAEYILLQHYLGTIDRRAASSASPAICARPRASTAAGRCFTAARSTSAPRSRPISR